jgi:Gpi18-like mannosyltransferase
LAGLLAGRLIYRQKGRQPMFPIYLVIVIGLAGYLLGSMKFQMLFVLIALLFFIAAAVFSYKIHKKDYISLW